MFLVAGSGHQSLVQALTRAVKVPTIYGAVAAGLLVALTVPVPTSVMRPVSLLSPVTLSVLIAWLQ